MRRPLIFCSLPLLSLLTAAPLVAQPIYKVTDEKEGVVFTDRPPATASPDAVEQVELPELNTAPAVTPSPRSSRSSDNRPAEAAKPSVRITSPGNESTIAMGPGDFTVEARVEPPLGPRERLQLTIDGAPHGTPQASPQWQIRGALRGPHDLQVTRLNTRGRELARSDTVRIYVLRPSIQRR